MTVQKQQIALNVARIAVLLIIIGMGIEATVLSPVSAAADASSDSSFTPSQQPANVDPIIDCSMRKLAWEYSQHLLPTRGLNNEVFDALQLASLCGLSPPSISPSQTPYVPRAPSLEPHTERERANRNTERESSSIWVDASSGSDSNVGTQNSPVRTISRALTLCRALGDGRSSNTPQRTIILRDSATHFLDDTLRLNAVDTGLKITSAPGEHAIISGGVSLKGLSWSPYKSGSPIQVATVPSTVQNFNTLLVAGRRLVRAKYPNGNPEIHDLHTPDHTGYIAQAASWLPPAAHPAAYEVHVASPSRDGTHFPNYQIGIDGSVKHFVPPESFWGSASPPAGATYVVPSGLVGNSSHWTNKTWSNPSTGFVHAYHGGHWGSWVFSIGSADHASRTVKFSGGGFQEARGSGSGAEFYFDNIFEELDEPGEWFFDETSRQLYLWPNSTSSLADTELIATQLDHLIEMDGSQKAPVQDVVISHVTLTATQATFMREFAVLSGGDWSAYLGGAIVLRGTERVSIDSCLLTSLGGNGVFIGGYNRDTLISNNEFVWLGSSAILQHGDSSGVSLLCGNQPRGTVIKSNLVHETGVYVKQSSPFCQAKSMQTTITGNVFFNGPRAGINFNDGAGGGNVVEQNLIFNQVRDTGDHGPFNSWDRQPFITRVADGKTPSLTPAENRITRNLLWNSYHSTWPIDHDDGSAFYTDTQNVMVYGGFKNYLGHSKIASDNIYIFPDADRPTFLNEPGRLQAFFSEPFCANSDGTKKDDSGWGDVYSNNKCLMAQSGNIYKWGNCNPQDPSGGNPPVPQTLNNLFYIPKGFNVSIKCGSETFSLSQYCKLGEDCGSKQLEIPDVSTIIEWSRTMLQF